LENSAQSSVSDALRYDGYGLTIDADGAFGSPWKYQGALDVAPTAEPLYDLGARDYAPSLGAFTSLDSLVGSAQDPLSLNRFLYAEANPASLIDPSGHRACTGNNDADCDKFVPTQSPEQVKRIVERWKREAAHRTWSYRRLGEWDPQSTGSGGAAPVNGGDLSRVDWRDVATAEAAVEGTDAFAAFLARWGPVAHLALTMGWGRYEDQATIWGLGSTWDEQAFGRTVGHQALRYSDVYSWGGQRRYRLRRRAERQRRHPVLLPGRQRGLVGRVRLTSRRRPGRDRLRVRQGHRR
jgi:RHS repeat-associated protein